MLRRDVLRAGFGTAAMVGVAGMTGSCTPSVTPEAPVVLLPPDGNGIALPVGFRSRVIARSLREVAATGHIWHLAPDGGAVFPRPGGWAYVSNSEFLPGGVGAIDFDTSGAIRGARSLVQEFTGLNCAGGATPWGTWLTCEEWEFGRVIECDPTGTRYAVERPALGWFAHEAVAADPEARVLYMTEDKPDGRLYRFTPEQWGDLSRGRLAVARVGGTGNVTWSDIRNPNPGLFDTPTRRQVPTSTAFHGGEGTVYDAGHLFFSTKGDNRVWDLDLRAMVIRVRYDAASSPGPQLTGVDNLAMSEGGLYAAEDGGNMELVLVRPDGRTTACLRIVGQDRSEITGPAFDPSGTRLYFSSQRGTDGLGITYEVTGPFADLRRRADRT